MPSPFPGMDPYLERPGLWHDVHFRLVGALADALSLLVRPRYYVAVEERVFLVFPSQHLLIGEPDVAVVGRPELSGGVAVAVAVPPRSAVVPRTIELPMPERVRQRYLEVREPAGDQVITTLEILSYTNKRPGPERRRYESKRLNILGSDTNLVELDLLRAHPPMEMRPVNGGRRIYRILVSRATQRPRAALYEFSVRDSIPAFPLPLRPDEPEPSVDLKPLLDGVYERASYGRRVNYRNLPEPPLLEADAEWARQLLAGARQESPASNL